MSEIDKETVRELLKIANDSGGITLDMALRLGTGWAFIVLGILWIVSALR